MFSKAVKIGNKIIGDGHPCFITAEAGSNHNGSIEKALKLVDIAKNAGADAVKFQMFRAEKLYTPDCGEADYIGMKKSVFDIIKEMEMPTGWIGKIAAYCRKKGIIFFSSPFDEESADALEKFVPVYKIASYEATHIPLIEHIAKKGKPIILSTGVTNMKEIKEALGVISSAGNSNVILQQCVASYPAKAADYNLSVIPAMKKEFGVPAGVSDHTTDPILIPAASAALGANIIEKHFTLSRKMPGPDHIYAIEPQELKKMVDAVREIEKALGTGKKTILPSEQELYKFARRSIFSIAEIKKGDALTRKNIAVLRNGKKEPGLPPREFFNVLGKKAKTEIKAYTGIKKEFLQ